MKVYFAGSIRGGRVDANLYERLIKYIQKTDVVLTEHVGNLNLSEEGQTVTDIYNQDTNWLRESDVLIAECTCPSLGVGYELAYAERFQKPCHIFTTRTEQVSQQCWPVIHSTTSIPMRMKLKYIL